MKTPRLLAGAMTVSLGIVAALAAAPSGPHAENVGSGQTGASVAFVRDAAKAVTDHEDQVARARTAAGLLQ